MKRNNLFEDSWKQCNEEAKLAKIQLKNIQQNVTELLDKIEACDELDAWVQSYLTKADDYLDSVKKYVVFGQEETTVIEPIEIESESPADSSAEPSSTPEIPKNDIEMPSIDQFDSDVEKISTDLTPEVPSDEGDDEEDIEDDENNEVEPDDIDNDDVESEDEDDIEMPSMNDFNLDGEENIPMDLTSKRKGEEDEITFDDIDYFNTQEFMDPEDDEKVSNDFDKVEEPNKSTKGKK